MSDKGAGVRFNIQFSQTDPAHLHVADILNSKARGDKAKYIVNAVLYYESQCGVSDITHMTLFDEKHLEAAINRILLSKEKGNAGILPVSPPLNHVHESQPIDVINKVDDIDTLGENGLNSITNAMEMFKKMK